MHLRSEFKLPYAFSGRKEEIAYFNATKFMSQECTFEDLDDHEKNDCYYPKGGISQLGILKADHGITDFANATQVQDAITAGTLKLVKNIKANLPEPSAVEGENPLACGSETVVDGYDYTVEVKDFNVNNINDEFYRKANLSQFAGLILYMCEEDQVRVIEQGVTFNARLVIPESNKEKQSYLVTAKWSQSVADEFPVLYEAPDGIFV